MATGDEVYLRGDANTDGSVRLIVRNILGGDPDKPNATHQMRIAGRWRDLEIAGGALLPAMNRSVGTVDDVGRISGHLIAWASNFGLTADRELYVPYLWDGPEGTLDQVSVYVTTGAASTNIKLALYAVGSTGWAGAKIADLGIAATITSSAYASATPATAVPISPGWYWLGLLSSHATNVIRGGGTYRACTPAGMAAAVPCSYSWRAGSYAAGLADPAATGSLTHASLGVAIPMACLRLAV